MNLYELTDPKEIEWYGKLAKHYGLPLNGKTMSNFKFMAQIKKDCQPYLKEAGQLVFRDAMWRGLGLDNDSDTLTKEAHLEGRIPRDMDVRIHDRLNYYFDEKYGHPYRNGVFVTGDLSEADNYGEVYQIFPIGNFDYLWSPTIEDLMGEIVKYDIDPDEFDEFGSKHLGGYKTTDLQQGVKMSHEIMIWTKKYHALSHAAVASEAWRDAYLNILRR